MCRYFQWGDEMPFDGYSKREPAVLTDQEKLQGSSFYLERVCNNL